MRETALYNAFNSAKKLDKKGDAKSIVSRLKKEFPKSVNIRRSLGEMKLWNGDTTGALPNFKNIDHKNYHDWYALAILFPAFSLRCSTLLHHYCSLLFLSTNFYRLHFSQLPDEYSHRYYE